jgi:hypothetical protein
MAITPAPPGFPPLFPPPVGCAGNDDVVENVMGWCGCAAAWLLFLSPIPVMLDIRRRGAVDAYSCVPYLVSGLQCALWVLYALPPVTPCKMQPLVTNGVGVGLELVYIAFYLANAGPRFRESVLQLGGTVVSFTVLTICGLLVAPYLPISGFPHETPPLSKQTTVLGFICAILNILMYAAPLSVRYRRSSSGPWPRVACSHIANVLRSISRACRSCGRWAASRLDASNQPATPPVAPRPTRAHSRAGRADKAHACTLPRRSCGQSPSSSCLSPSRSAASCARRFGSVRSVRLEPRRD